jgi:hypothetical protein
MLANSLELQGFDPKCFLNEIDGTHTDGGGYPEDDLAQGAADMDGQ